MVQTSAVVDDGTSGAGSVEKVEKLILEFVNKNKDFALNATRDLHDRCSANEDIYRGKSTKRGNRDGRKRKTELRIPEAANQVDLVSAVFYENLFQNNTLYRVIAKNGEDQQRADATRSVIDSELHRKAFHSELFTAILRYAKYPISGFKVCVDYSEEPQIERKTVPNNEADVAMAVQSGMTPFSPADPSQNGDYSKVLMEKTENKGLFSYYIRAVEPRRILLSDFSRNVQKQPSIHEAHYWTSFEMEEQGNFQNIDKIGEPNAAGEEYPNHSQKSNRSSSIVDTESPNFQKYKVWESWGPLPWKKWINDGKLMPEDLFAFAAQYQFDISEFETTQKWCCYHLDDKALLKVYPNYLFKKSEYPYDMDSYIPGDNEAVGESFLERIKDFDMMLASITNMMMDNLRMRLRTSVVVPNGSELTTKKLEELEKDWGVVQMDSNRPLDEQIKFFSTVVPDLSKGALDGIAFITSQSQTYGTPAIVQGIGAADTATQDAINNSRGQQRLNSPFRRFVYNVMVPQIEKLRDLIFRNFDSARWVSIAGEEGATFNKSKWITPEQITNRFEIQPMASFDFSSRAAKAQQLLGLINVISRLGNPELVIRLSKMALERMDFTRPEINEALNLAGIDTDPEQELLTIINNPEARIKVRPEDNHQLALQMAQEVARGDEMARMQNQQAANQKPPIASQWNFQRYVMEHQMYFAQQQQEAMMKQQEMEERQQRLVEKRRGPQPVPTGEGPQDDEGSVKQTAQARSGPDEGNMTRAGLTGMATEGLPSRVKGEIIPN